MPAASSVWLLQVLRRYLALSFAFSIPWLVRQRFEVSKRGFNLSRDEISLQILGETHGLQLALSVAGLRIFALICRK